MQHVKLPFGMSACHFGKPGLHPSFSALPIQLPTYLCGRQQIMAEVVGDMDDVPGPQPFTGLAWSWVLRAFEE